MNFKKYWVGLTPAEKQALAKRLQSSQMTLSQIAHGHRNPSFTFAELIRVVTGQWRLRFLGKSRG